MVVSRGGWFCVRDGFFLMAWDFTRASICILADVCRAACGTYVVSLLLWLCQFFPTPSRDQQGFVIAILVFGWLLDFPREVTMCNVSKFKTMTEEEKCFPQYVFKR